jgi:hypothetical protein
MIELPDILAGTENRKKTVFPFTKKELYIRVLSEWDLQEASRMTDAEYKGREVGFQNLHERNSYKTMYELYLSLVDADGNQAFLSFKEFSKMCTPESALRLVEEQNDFQKDVCPPLDDISKDQIEKILFDLKKNCEKLADITDSRLLKKLLRYLVSPQ